MSDIIRPFFNAIHDVEDDVLDEYLSHWQEFACPRKTIMTREGQTERYMYFVLDGVQKSYYLENGKQHVIAFTYPPSFSGIPESFLNQSPSRYFLEALTDSKFLRIPYDSHQQLMSLHRPIETMFRKATEAILIGVLQRHYELMAFDIQTRFTTFVRRSPHLLNMVPHKDLASYLNIDATNFSKLLGAVRI